MSCPLESSAFEHLVASLDIDDQAIMSFVTAQFDDSGTHRESSIAIAACLLATVEQWREFNRNWAEANERENFGVFHMADFAAGHQQFEAWDEKRKERVLTRLCSIISTRICAGWSVAVTKKDYDEIITDLFREWSGDFHYTFCVRQCCSSIGLWRRSQKPPATCKYIFDQMSHGKGEIMKVMDRAIRKSKIESAETSIMPLTGYSFEDKGATWPLQASDIYAWTAFQQMQKLISNRKTSKIAELAFDLLSESQLLKWGYFIGENLRQWAAAEVNALIDDLLKRKAASVTAL